jgi:hypothetical protein
MASCGNQPLPKDKKIVKTVLKRTDAVIDTFTWAKVFKTKSNFIMDYNTGNPVVLNPDNLKEVIRVIEVPRAIDSYRALDIYRNSAKKENREKYNSALQNFNKQRTEKSELIIARTEELQKAFVDLAQAIGNYDISPSAEAAKQVALAQRLLLAKEAEVAPKGPKGEACEVGESCERIVKAFEYPIPPSGDLPTPPVNTYIKYEMMGDKREVGLTALTAPPPTEEQEQEGLEGADAEVLA